MNAGLIQAISGSMPQSNIRSKNFQAVDGVGNTAFGSVLSNITASQKQSDVILEDTETEVELDSTILNIFNATTVEELIVGLKTGDISMPELQNLQESDGVSHLLDVDISKLIDKVMPLLEQAGLSESEIMAASTATDLWSLLTIVDEIGPKLFSEIVASLEGKGVIPKEQAIELLTILKSAAIIAPKTDLTMKQEQQLFSLQGLLVAAEERFESTLRTNQSQNNVVQLLEARQIIRFVIPNETNQDNLKDTPKGTGQQPIMDALAALKARATLVPTELPSEANQGHLKDTPKETLQQPLMNVLGAMRTEAAPAELESRNNTRNETLLREMQAIFKRSNFGHTGGTNRLLIKLYPEHLGQVRIELMQTNGVMTARILASSALGKEMLDNQLHQLRSAFLQQNLQVERIDISQMLEDASKNEHQHGMFNQHFKNEQEDENEQDEQNEEEKITFQEYMIELEA